MTVVGNHLRLALGLLSSSSETERGNQIEGLIASRNCNFNPIFCTKPYACRPLASTSNRPGRGCMLSAAPLAVLLTALACYLTRCWRYSPRDYDSSASVRCLLV